MLFQSSVCQSSKQEGQDRWTAAFKLNLEWLERDIAPGLGTIGGSEMDSHCTEAGTPGTNARAEHLCVLQQGGERLMGYFLMCFFQGWRLAHGLPYSQDLTDLGGCAGLPPSHSSSLSPTSTLLPKYFRSLPKAAATKHHEPGRFQNEILYF